MLPPELIEGFLQLPNIRLRAGIERLLDDGLVCTGRISEGVSQRAIHSKGGIEGVDGLTPGQDP